MEIKEKIRKYLHVWNPGKILFKIDAISLIDKIKYNPFYLFLLMFLIMVIVQKLSNLNFGYDYISFNYFILTFLISFLILHSAKTNKITLYENCLGIGGFSHDRQLLFSGKKITKLVVKYDNITDFRISNKKILLKLNPDMKKDYFNKLDNNNPFVVFYTIFSLNIAIVNLSYIEIEKIKEILINKGIKYNN